MTSCRFLVAAAAGLLTLAAGSAPAQGLPPPSNRPPVSPYLNLIRRGQSPALNYFNLVRPQNQFIASIDQLQQQVGVNRQGLATLEQSMGQPAARLPPTGFVPQFMTHRQFFFTYSGGGGVGLTPGAAGQGTNVRPPAPRGR